MTSELRCVFYIFSMTTILYLPTVLGGHLQKKGADSKHLSRIVSQPTL